MLLSFCQRHPTSNNNTRIISPDWVGRTRQQTQTNTTADATHLRSTPSAPSYPTAVMMGSTYGGDHRTNALPQSLINANVVNNPTINMYNIQTSVPQQSFINAHVVHNPTINVIQSPTVLPPHCSSASSRAINNMNAPPPSYEEAVKNSTYYV